MQRISRILVVVGLALAAVHVQAACNAVPVTLPLTEAGDIAPELESPVVPLAETSAETPEAVVQSFYTVYLEHAGFDPDEGVRRNPLVSGAYREMPHLSAEMVSRVDEMVASGPAIADPFLCAQDIPESFRIGETTVLDSTASVLVATIWNAGTEYEFTSDLTVRLSLTDGQWKIAEVVCATN